MMAKKIRTLQFIGSWYPSSPHGIQALLNKNLDYFSKLTDDEKAAMSTFSDEIWGRRLENRQSIGSKDRSAPQLAIVPHAGLVYSGYGLAVAFDPLDWKRVKHVIFLSPSHYYPLEEAAFVYSDHGLFETPFGNLHSWKEGLELLEQQQIIKNNEAIQKEHALEIPLVSASSYFSKDVDVLLLLVSSFSDSNMATELAKVLQDVVGLDPGATLVVTSSDFIHYGPRFGFMEWGKLSEDRTRTLKQLAQVQSEVLRSIINLQRDTFFDLTVKNRKSICGRYAILVAIELCKQFELGFGDTFCYYHSDAISEEPSSNVVCYASLGFT